MAIPEAVTIVATDDAIELRLHGQLLAATDSRRARRALCRLIRTMREDSELTESCGDCTTRLRESS